MARLIPNIEIDDISLKPERDVARALVELLPNDCTVYHSYPWLRLERGHYNRVCISCLSRCAVPANVRLNQHNLALLDKSPHPP